MLPLTNAVVSSAGTYVLGGRQPIFELVSDHETARVLSTIAYESHVHFYLLSELMDIYTGSP